MEIPSLQELPRTPGAYILVMEVVHPLFTPVPARDTGVLTPGTYAYAGSAKGPGGPRARIARHARTGKSPRWHVDYITNITGLHAAAVFAGGDEHRLWAALAALPGAAVPLPGFGSSDCRVCASHLVALPDGSDPAAVFDSIARRVKIDPVIWKAPPTA